MELNISRMKSISSELKLEPLVEHMKHGIISLEEDDRSHFLHVAACYWEH
jgi:hypothetical protein